MKITAHGRPWAASYTFQSTKKSLNYYVTMYSETITKSYRMKNHLDPIPLKIPNPLNYYVTKYSETITKSYRKKTHLDPIPLKRPLAVYAQLLAMLGVPVHVCFHASSLPPFLPCASSHRVLSLSLLYLQNGGNEK